MGPCPKFLDRLLLILLNNLMCSYLILFFNRALEAHPTINDELPYRIMTGAVQVRPEIATVAEDGVLFTDATLVS